MQEGGKREWEFVLKLAQQPSTPAQGLAALVALRATRDPALADATFAFAMNRARDQDAPYCARGLARNKSMRKVLVAHVKENFDALEKRYAGTFGMVRWIEASFARAPRARLQTEYLTSMSV